METFEIAVRLVEALVWPITLFILIFVFLYLFRTQVTQLLERLIEISYRGVKLRFGKELDEAEVTAKSIKSPTIKGIKTEPEPSTQEYALDRFSQIASFSPRSAVIEAWLVVETAIIEAAQKLGMERRTFTQLRNVVDELVRDNILEKRVMNLFNELREIRNRAAHTNELGISIDDAIRYAELCLILSDTINIAILALETKRNRN